MSISITVAARGVNLRVDEVPDAVGDCSGLDQTLGRPIHVVCSRVRQRNVKGWIYYSK